MSDYVNTVELEFNGFSYSDFDTFTKTSVTKAKQVNLMNKTGTARMTPRYGFSLTHKRSFNGLPFDIDDVHGGTLTAVYPDGRRETYVGVATAETGDGTVDGETELTEGKTFVAEDLIKE